MTNRIAFICQQEGIPFNSDLGEALNLVSGGDLRKAITYLQSAFTLHEQDINAESIIEIAGRVPSDVIDGLLQTVRSNSFEKLQKSVDEVIFSGYPVSQVIAQVLLDSIFYWSRILVLPTFSSNGNSYLK